MMQMVFMWKLFRDGYSCFVFEESDLHGSTVTWFFLFTQTSGFLRLVTSHWGVPLIAWGIYWHNSKANTFSIMMRKDSFRLEIFHFIKLKITTILYWSSSEAAVGGVL